MSFTWQVTPERALTQLAEAYIDYIEAEIVRFAESLLDPIEAWMKQEARWNDVTGDARANLYSDIEHVVRESVTIIVSHGPAIEYSVYLETLGAGRLGVIADTVDHFGPVVFRGVQAIVQGGGR